MPGAKRSVLPQVEVIPISDGDTITVKRRLNSGEERELVSRAVIDAPDGRRLIDGPLHTRSVVVAYLLDSTVPELVGIGEKTPEDRGAVLDALDPDDFSEIAKAIAVHETKVQAERNARKNGQGGAMTSSAISPSPSGSEAGDSNGSGNSTQMTTT